MMPSMRRPISLNTKIPSGLLTPISRFALGVLAGAIMGLSLGGTSWTEIMAMALSLGLMGACPVFGPEGRWMSDCQQDDLKLRILRVGGRVGAAVYVLGGALAFKMLPVNLAFFWLLGVACSFVLASGLVNLCVQLVLVVGRRAEERGSLPTR